MKNVKREKMDEDLYIVLKTIFHYERIIASRYGLDFDEIYALEYLRHNSSARVTDLSTEMLLPMFYISRMVNKLAQRSYLSKEKDLIDKRNIHLHLEKAGEKVLYDILKGSIERITNNTFALDEDKVNEIINVVENLHIVLGVTEHVIRQG